MIDVRPHGFSSFRKVALPPITGESEGVSPRRGGGGGEVVGEYISLSSTAR